MVKNDVVDHAGQPAFEVRVGRFHDEGDVNVRKLGGIAGESAIRGVGHRQGCPVGWEVIGKQLLSKTGGRGRR